MSELRDHILKNLPRCLADVMATVVEPIDPRDCTVVAFALSQEDAANDSAKILGYPLADYNSACRDDPDFISPLSLRWPDGNENLVFDSDLHGYHGEMESSAKLHGEGTPKEFLCPHCSHNEFNVQVQFDYWDACDDLWEDEPELPIQDYFTNIIFSGRCLKCGTQTNVLEMDL